MPILPVSEIENKTFDYIIIGTYLDETADLAANLPHRRWRGTLQPLVHSSDLAVALVFCFQTAGLTLAARLSEDASTSVLCLEAGDANLNDPAISEWLPLFECTGEQPTCDSAPRVLGVTFPQCSV